MRSKIILGLGNPGPEYDSTRHNVGWWIVDRLAYDWDFGSFELRGPSLVSEGEIDGRHVTLVKPSTFMNRSGLALASLALGDEVDLSRDLLVAVDDAALAPGRIRLRAKGSAGGHNGLKSIARVLGSNDFFRLRLGVGERPDHVDLTDWVLSPMPPEDEDSVVALLPELAPAVRAWMDGDADRAMTLINR